MAAAATRSWTCTSVSAPAATRVATARTVSSFVKKKCSKKKKVLYFYSGSESTSVESGACRYDWYCNCQYSEYFEFLGLQILLMLFLPMLLLMVLILLLLSSTANTTARNTTEATYTANGTDTTVCLYCDYDYCSYFC